MTQLRKIAALDEIKKLKGIIRQLIEAYESKNLEMRSPEIGEPENGIPYHEWHEEWLHHARAALSLPSQDRQP